MRNPRQRIRMWSAIVALLPVILVACGQGNTPTATTDDMTGSLTVAYSTTYVFDSDDTSVIW
ncbi:MAG: hypothetical protein E6I58_05205, partial [Chloroflexi bacterium]